MVINSQKKIETGSELSFLTSLPQMIYRYHMLITSPIKRGQTGWLQVTRVHSQIACSRILEDCLSKWGLSVCPILPEGGIDKEMPTAGYLLEHSAADH